MQPEFLPAKPQLRIPPLIEHQAHHRGSPLPDHRGDGRAGHSHLRKTRKAEDHDGIQNNIGYGADQLRNHGQHRIAGGLQHALKNDGQKNARTPGHGNGQIIHAVFQDAVRVLQIIGNHQAHQTAGSENPHQHKQQAAAHFDHDSVPGSQPGFLRPPFPQPAAEEAVDPRSHTDAEGNHQHLKGKRQGDRGQAVGIEAGDKNTVHHVIKRLDQHGNHNRNADLGNQTLHLHGAQHDGPVGILHR